MITYGEVYINPNRTCAVTGNRYLLNNFNKTELKEKFIEIIDEGYDTFLVGMAVGFDTKCFLILEELRKTFNIKIISCIPCFSQPDKFSLKQQSEYFRMVDSADGKIYTGQVYTPTCMQTRNVFMVDNCSLLIAYMKKQKGGTVNTVNYAIKKDKRIIYF